MPQVAAYPFVNITIDTTGLQPRAQRAPGVLCLIGAPATEDGSIVEVAADVGAIEPVDSIDDARRLFGDVGGTLQRNRLYNALELALQQDPRPSRLYGLRSASDSEADLQAALRRSEAAGDITFVALAGEARPDRIAALRSHVDTVAGSGLKRMGVAMIDPTIAAADNYVSARVGAGGDYLPARSDSGRMALIAARGAIIVEFVRQGNQTVRTERNADVAAAAASAIAGQPPQASPLLKQLRGFTIPKSAQFRASEITGLSLAGVMPVIDPILLPGEGLHFAEGTTYTTDRSLIYVDIVRVLDDIEFRLKAGLIGLVGDARITRPGLILLRSQIDGILRPLLNAQVIDAYEVELPLLAILSLPPESRTPGDNEDIREARANRQVPLSVTVTYGPAMHRLELNLALRF
jgi:hypothetical protein